MTTLQCPQCGQEYTPSTWMEDDQGICIDCIDGAVGAGQDAMAAVRMAEQARRDAAVAALPPAYTVVRYGAPRRDRYGRVTLDQPEPLETAPAEPVEVDGFRFRTKGYVPDGWHVTLYRWEED